MSVYSSKTNGKQRISGVVVDQNGDILPGVHIVAEGGILPTLTDANGRFSIEIPDGTVINKLTFSFIGMKKKTVQLKGEEVLRIEMEDDITALDEVVVTGYQTLGKSRIAGSTSSISASDLTINPTTTLEQALQGKLAGVAVTNTSGLVGVRQKTRVRGTSTLSGNQEPVWVVDGIIQEDPLPFSTQTFNSLGEINQDNFDYIRNFVGSSISWLNPTDIETITVLKDASATAIYGVRAANGVIVITTKRGKEGRASISYSGGFEIGERVTYNRLELMNSKERVAVSREIFDRGLIATWTNNSIGYAGALKKYLDKEVTAEEFDNQVAVLETTNTDWFGILFRNPFSHRHNMSISGGNDKARYYASLGYNTTKGTAIGNESTGYSANVGIDINYSEKLYASVRIAGSHNKTDAFNMVNPYSYASTTNRVISAFNDDGSLAYYQNQSGYLFNIINERDESGIVNNTTAVNTNININYEPTRHLKFQSLFSLNTSSVNGESYATEKTEYIATNFRFYDYGIVSPSSDEYKKSMLPSGGEYNSENTRSMTWNWRNSVSFDKIFNEVHAFTSMLGVEFNSTKYDGFSSTQYGYLRDRGKSFTTPPITRLLYGTTVENEIYKKYKQQVTDRVTNNIGAYITFNYAYDNRYVANLSIRTDASNRFGKYENENFNPVYAGGLRWNVRNERWFEEQDILSDLSLRASFGYQRNMASNYSPSLIVKVPSGAANQTIDANTGEALLQISSLPYKNLRWEKTISQNYGMDIGVLKNKVRISLEYYMKHGKDIITTLLVPREFGVENMPINGGSLTNRGYEVTVAFTPVRLKDFTWDVGINTSKNFNEITKVGMQNYTWRTAVSGQYQKEGYPVSGLWAFKYEGIDNETGYPIINLDVEEGSDPLNDPTAYMVYVGKLDPDFTGGMSSSLRYKQFSLSANFYLQVGGKKFLSSAYKSTGSSSSYNSLPSEYENLSSELNNRWTPGSTGATLPGLPDKNVTNILLPNESSYSNVYEMFDYSTARIVDASSFRCNNISINYNIPESLTRYLRCNTIMVGGSLSNLFTIVSKDFKGRDPEVATGAQPRTRSFSFNFSINF